MIDVSRTDFDVELDLPDGRWIEVYNISYDPGERGNTQGPPENCWPEVPADVEFDALVGASDNDCSIKREATDEEKDAIAPAVLAWYENRA